MKILVITDLYPVKENEKTTPRTIFDFVKEWKISGHEVKVIKPNFLFNSFVRKKPFYKDGIYGDIENINYFLPFLGNIRRKIKTDLNTDVVISHMPSGEIFANRLGLDFIAGVHISDLEVLTNPLYSVYFKSELEAAHRNAKKIACRSEVIRDKFLKLYPQYKDKTFVCFSGIDEKYITKRIWTPKKRIKVLVCANLIKRKNVDKVIKECENLDVDLTIIGGGKEMGRLKKLSAKPLFLGHLEHENVPEEMRKADIFALPSVNETFGMVYLEAMASGCITICTENDGIAGIIKDGENGFFWKKGIIQNIINSADNQKILKNTYDTIMKYTASEAAQNYLNNL